jgi:hypothetical protein
MFNQHIALHLSHSSSSATRFSETGLGTADKKSLACCDYGETQLPVKAFLWGAI